MLIWTLRIFFILVMVAMLAVTTHASLTESMFQIPERVTSDPWFIATLFDAYFGFLTFYVWLLWVTPQLWKRGLWLLAILLLGNMAMAAFMLLRLFRLPTSAGWRQVWTNDN